MVCTSWNLPAGNQDNVKQKARANERDAIAQYTILYNIHTYIERQSWGQSIEVNVIRRLRRDAVAVALCAGFIDKLNTFIKQLNAKCNEKECTNF